MEQQLPGCDHLLASQQSNQDQLGKLAQQSFLNDVNKTSEHNTNNTMKSALTPVREEESGVDQDHNDLSEEAFQSKFCEENGIHFDGSCFHNTAAEATVHNQMLDMREENYRLRKDLSEFRQLLQAQNFEQMELAQRVLELQRVHQEERERQEERMNILSTKMEASERSQELFKEQLVNDQKSFQLYKEQQDAEFHKIEIAIEQRMGDLKNTLVEKGGLDDFFTNVSNKILEVRQEMKDSKASYRAASEVLASAVKLLSGDLAEFQSKMLDDVKSLEKEILNLKMLKKFEKFKDADNSLNSLLGGGNNNIEENIHMENHEIIAVESEKNNNSANSAIQIPTPLGRRNTSCITSMNGMISKALNSIQEEEDAAASVINNDTLSATGSSLMYKRSQSVCDNKSVSSLRSSPSCIKHTTKFLHAPPPLNPQINPSNIGFIPYGARMNSHLESHH